MPLPCHGPIPCRLCWSAGGETEKVFGPQISTEPHRFRMVNDPGAWGSPDPVVLVLGMSKGNTQAEAMARAAVDGSFNDVPFAKMRLRLLQSLQAVGLLPEVRTLDPMFAADEPDFGWGSILRCSLTGWDKKKSRWSGASGDVIPGLKHAEGNAYLQNCLRRHLTGLSDRTRLVILLGNDDGYIRVVRRAFEAVFGPTSDIAGAGSQAFRFGAQTAVHIGHPSPLNGYFSSFLAGSVATSQGAKRAQAQMAVELALEGDLQLRARI